MRRYCVERAMARNAPAAMRPQPPSVPTIVLVESRALARMAIAGYLRECGYEVIETDGAAEAKRAFASVTDDTPVVQLYFDLDSVP